MNYLHLFSAESMDESFTLVAYLNELSFPNLIFECHKEHEGKQNCILLNLSLSRVYPEKDEIISKIVIDIFNTYLKGVSKLNIINQGINDRYNQNSQKIEEIINGIDYLFGKINWDDSFLDDKAIRIMNNISNKIRSLNAKI